MTKSRKKTLEHMEKLLAAAAVACTPTGASKDGGTGTTSTGYAVVDPIPTPALDAGAITPVPLDAGSPADAGKKGDGGKALTMEKIEIEHKTAPTVTAYGVVDPMPPPALRTK